MYLVIALACASLLLADEPYCAVRYRRLCQGKGRHVACQFPASGPGPTCQNYTQIKFTSELRRFITNYINRRRQRVAAGHERVRGGVHLPRPQIMMFVEWDRELAYLAQRLADQCLFVHDDCRATVRYPYAGQTVGEVRLRRFSDNDELSAQRAIRRVLDAWWGERRRVDPRQLTEPFRITSRGSVWGHFSQLATWSLRAAGCGAVRHGHAQPRLLLICDFSHTNMLGQRTLTPGKLTPCPDHTQRRPQSTYPLLCASLRDDNNEQAKQTTEEYGYDEDDEFSTEITTIRTFHNAQSGGRRRMPFEDRFLGSAVAVDTEDFIPDAERPFYNRYIKLRSDKGQRMDEIRWKPDKRITVENGRYIAMDRSTRAGNKYTSKGGLHRSLDEVIPLRTTTQVSDRETFGKWQTRRFNLVKWHDPQEEHHQSEEFVHRQNNIDLPQESYPTSSRRPNAELLNGRHKWNWKYNRERPQRPGAAALLHIKKLELPKETVSVQHLTTPLFLMDDEDVHQLYRDTGFHPSWRKSKS